MVRTLSTSSTAPSGDQQPTLSLAAVAQRNPMKIVSITNRRRPRKDFAMHQCEPHWFNTGAKILRDGFFCTISPTIGTFTHCCFMLLAVFIHVPILCYYWFQKSPSSQIGIYSKRQFFDVPFCIAVSQIIPCLGVYFMHFIFALKFPFSTAVRPVIDAYSLAAPAVTDGAIMNDTETTEKDLDDSEEEPYLCEVTLQMADRPGVRNTVGRFQSTAIATLAEVACSVCMTSLIERAHRKGIIATPIGILLQTFIEPKGTSLYATASVNRRDFMISTLSKNGDSSQYHQDDHQNPTVKCDILNDRNKLVAQVAVKYSLVIHDSKNPSKRRR